MLNLKANQQWTSESFTKYLKLVDAMSKVPHQLASLNPGPEAEMTEEFVLGGHAKNKCV